MVYSQHDRRFAYIYHQGGTCISEPSLIPAEKQSFIQWNPPSESWQANIDKNMWWGKANIHKPCLRGDGTYVDSRMVELHKKLLSFGGNETCFPVYEEDLEHLLSRGQLWVGDKIRMMKGRPSQCHSNSCELYELNKDKHEIAIATGYGLSKDGLWRQHSWLVLRTTRSVKIIETTEKRILYFGYVMTDKEADEFCEMNP